MSLIPSRALSVLPALLLGGCMITGELPTRSPAPPPDGDLPPISRQSVDGADARDRLVTPLPETLRCDGETFRVAFAAGTAYVTVADGTLYLLERVDGRGSGPRVFSDGRLSFTQEEGGATGPRVLFARGRGTPVACEAPGEGATAAPR